MKIYVVVAYGGSYDDSWESNICARSTQEGAELAIEEEKARDARIQEALPKLKEHFESLRTTAPVMQILPALDPLPPRGKREDVAMKARREQLAESNRVQLRNQVLMQEWHSQVKAAQYKYAQTHCGLTLKDLEQVNLPCYHVYHPETDYRIDELELELE